MQKKFWIITGISFIVLLLLLYVLGPRPSKPDYSLLIQQQYADDLRLLEDSVRNAEASINLKPDNEARIIWAMPYQKTPFSIVYLHGNGASQEEGDPIHEALAHRYGCNLFLSRLSEHGIAGDNPMLTIDAFNWMQSALDAIVLGKKIGEKVILVSTSTGSTLGLYLASKYPDLVDGHIMMSPNIDLFDSRSFLLSQPYGLQVARRIMDSDFYGWEAPGTAQRYWYTRYRIEGLCTLKSMIDCNMDETTFENVTDPLIMVYYYKDDTRQDEVVSVKRMKEMFEQLGTPPAKKIQVALPDAGTHIIGSDIFNKNLQSLWEPLAAFCEDVLNMAVVNDTDWKPFVDNRSR